MLSESLVRPLARLAALQVEGRLAADVAAHLHHVERGGFGVGEHDAVREAVGVRFVDLDREEGTSVKGRMSFRSSWLRMLRQSKARGRT